jgi:hypothetical protein
MRQLDAEIRRFFARRIVRGTLLVAALIIVAATTIGTVRGSPGGTQMVKPRVFVGPDVPSDDFSRQTYIDDTPIEITKPDTRTNVGKDLKNVLEGTGVAMLFVAFVLGASFIGAEFNVGSLTTQLLFEPRRLRVHVAKAAAVGFGIFVLSLAVSALIALAMFVGSHLGGVVEGVDASFWWARLREALRIAIVVAAGAAMAYAVTIVTKRTSAGIIVFFVQYPLLFLIDPDKKPFGFISRYNPLRALLTVLVNPRQENPLFENGIRTVAGGVVLTLIWLGVTMCLSSVSFARAEVR